MADTKFWISTQLFRSFYIMIVFEILSNQEDRKNIICISFCVWPISNCNISSTGSNLCIWCIGLFDKQITFLVHFPPSIFACLNLHHEAPLTCFRVGWFSCTINILTTTRSFWLKRRTNDRIFSLSSRLIPIALLFSYSFPKKSIE